MSLGSIGSLIPLPSQYRILLQLRLQIGFHVYHARRDLERVERVELFLIDVVRIPEDLSERETKHLSCELVGFDIRLKVRSRVGRHSLAELLHVEDPGGVGSERNPDGVITCEFFLGWDRFAGIRVPQFHLPFVRRFIGIDSRTEL